MSNIIGETTFLVSGRFENGEPKLRVTAFTGYGSRQASVSRDVEDESLNAAFGKLADKAIKSVEGDLRTESVTGAAEALVVATRRKEVI
jgi:hypothetical protein